MEWVNEPPCTQLDVEREEPSRGILILAGPRGSARVKGGLVAAMGAAFAAGAVAFLRMPVPRAWKLIPALMAATGGGVAALGMATVVSDVRVEVERGKGIRWAWRPRPMQEREVKVAAADIATYEIKTNVTRSSGEFSFREAAQTTYHLMVVTKAGRAYPVEEFDLSAQAELRRDQIQRALGSRAKPKAAPKKKRA
ncbi:MAG TPA: hypothetical protein VND93_01530 [Myxococcales bacterium]|jgi:hypothetical protein|nr:hypothetical protein [Myxococcales bacterium]